jgi:5-methylcytosine-specific restriction protein A
MAEWPYSTQRWQRLRLSKLRATPLCEYCTPGREQPASQVDHKTPVKEGGDPWAWDNLASCCASCHSRKTASEDGAFGNAKRKGRPLKGCDAQGRPMDRRHWWNH